MVAQTELVAFNGNILHAAIFHLKIAFNFSFTNNLEQICAFQFIQN